MKFVTAPVPFSHKNTVLRAALLAAFCLQAGSCAYAADEQELAQIRAEIKQMRSSYESRMQALEQRLAQAQARNEQLQAKVSQVENNASAANGNTGNTAVASAAASAPVAKAKAGMANEFNPAIALNLSGTLANLSQDPDTYQLQGFMPTGSETGPGKRGFGLGESELMLFANVDPHFAGQLTFALPSEGGAEVEEAFVETRDLNHGIKIKAGRMLSGIGYLNSRHAHTWDFVDAPLAYQAFFGGQYKREGVQLKWLAPSERFLEFGLELGNGGSFPGNQRNKNGFADSALFVHVGDDVGENTSWMLGAAYLRNKAQRQTYQDSDGVSSNPVENAFSGRSKTFVLDGVLKWAPEGNSSRNSFKLSGEYIRRQNDGELEYAPLGGELLASSYASRQSGWYVQGVYQFKPEWRVGLRHERLSSGTPDIGLINGGALTADNFPLLASFNPRKTSLMFDFSPSEFSRWRLQFARDESQPGRVDRQIFLQYNMSLGAHAAHAF